MNYRGIVIEHDLMSSGWCFFDPVNRTRISADRLDILYQEIDSWQADAPDGAD